MSKILTKADIEHAASLAKHSSSHVISAGVLTVLSFGLLCVLIFWLSTSFVDVTNVELLSCGGLAIVFFILLTKLEYREAHRQNLVWMNYLKDFPFFAPNGERVTFRRMQGTERVTVEYQSGLHVTYPFSLLSDEKGNGHAPDLKITLELNDSAILRASKSEWATPDDRIGTVVNASFYLNTEHTDQLHLTFKDGTSAWHPVKLLREMPKNDNKAA